MIFDQTKIKAEKMDVEIRIPRITNIQRHRANTKHNDPAKYYRINIFLPYLDNLISELNLRFPKDNNVIISNLKKLFQNIISNMIHLMKKYCMRLKNMKQIYYLALKYFVENCIWKEL